MRVNKKDVNNWEAERDLGYMEEYNRIISDPKRLKAAQSVAKQRMQQYGSIVDNGKKSKKKK